MASPKAPPRWPLEPLLKYAAANLGKIPHSPKDCLGCMAEHIKKPVDRNCLSMVELAGILGRPVRTVQRWKLYGVRWIDADKAAVTLGTHAACIWLGWPDAPLEDD